MKVPMGFLMFPALAVAGPMSIVLCLLSDALWVRLFAIGGALTTSLALLMLYAACTRISQVPRLQRRQVGE